MKQPAKAKATTKKATSKKSPSKKKAAASEPAPEPTAPAMVPGPQADHSTRPPDGGERQGGKRPGRGRVQTRPT